MELNKVFKNRSVKIILIVLALLFITAVIRLLLLAHSVGTYRAFWQQKAKQGGQFTYVALGDSAAQGIGASQPLNGYVGLIAKRVEAKTGQTVRIVNLSKSGAVVSDVLNHQLPELANYQPNLVTIEIGANDVAKFDAKKFEQEFNQLADKLPKGTYVSNMPYFSSRPSRRPAAFRASEIIQQVVTKHPDLKFVDLQTITKQRNSIFNYAADLFHPNNRAYKNWADAFWSQIEANLNG